MAFTDRLHNRGSVSTGYDIDYSLLLEGSDSEKLSRTPSSDGNMQTWTVSCWVKRTELGTNQMIFSASDTYIYFTTSNKIQGNLRSPSSSNLFLVTNREFTDTAAWYHIVLRVDVGNSTAADKARLYINGVQETSLSNTGYTSASGNTAWNDSSRSHVIGNYVSGDYYKHGYIAEFHSIDGQSLGPDSFGQTNTDGEWVPKQYTGTYGSQGFYLDFADASDLGDDESGNGNDFTESNIDSKNQSTDTPTNNFCTMNNNSRTNGNIRTIYGGSYISTDGGSGWCSMNATMGVQNGKWYWESKRIDTYVMKGIASWNDPWIPHRAGGYYLGNVATGGSLGLYFLNGNIYNDANYADVPGVANGETLGIALDMDNLRLYYSKNGTWMTGTGSSQMDPAGGNYGINISGAFSGVSGATEIILPSISVYQGNDAEVNFGGYTKTTISSSQADANGYGTFEYAPPTGYYALCSKNLGEFG